MTKEELEKELAEAENELNSLDSQLEEIIVGLDVSDVRKERLKKAIELGASKSTLKLLANARRTAMGATIVLPGGKYENLSRGRGWARQGKGSNVVWGEREGGGYRVGPGSWDVGSTDGFQRKSSVKWKVKNVKVGEETWTIAE